MSNSFIAASAKFNFNLNIACPDKYKPNKNTMSWVKKNKAKIFEVIPMITAKIQIV